MKEIATTKYMKNKRRETSQNNNKVKLVNAHRE